MLKDNQEDEDKLKTAELIVFCKMVVSFLSTKKVRVEHFVTPSSYSCLYVSSLVTLGLPFSVSSFEVMKQQIQEEMAEDRRDVLFWCTYLDAYIKQFNCKLE